VLERALWRLIGRTSDGRRRWTDDTQMALDVAESVAALGRVDPDDLARRFAASYRWSRGYGPGAARVLKHIRRGRHWRDASRRVYQEGSYGNGGAMRAPVIGLYCAADLASLPGHARTSAQITHAHPLAEESAVLIALATALALSDRSAAEIVAEVAAHAQHAEFRRKLGVAAAWLDPAGAQPAAVREKLGNGIAATESCVTALYIGLRFLERPFEELLGFAAACGGDVDTIGAMAGAVWGARNGVEALPVAALERLEQVERIADVASNLYERAVVRRRMVGGSGGG